MKKNEHKISKIIIVIVMLISINVNSSYATGMPVVDIAASIKAVTAGIKQGLQLYAEVKSKLALIQQVKKMDLANQASSLAGNAINQIGQSVTKSITSKQNDSTNVLTNGQKVVTNLDQFLKNNSVNAIKSSISDLSSSGNIYTNTGIKNIIENVRTSDVGSVSLPLPKIVQDEVCNSSQLKDTIKNGEPSGWVNPKPAIANIDIDKLCNVDLSKSDTDTQKAEASLISLAKSGYAGSKTAIALSDAANTAAGIQNKMQILVDNKSKEAVANATELYSANNGVIGNMICLDTKGNVKHFDPSDPNNNFCSKFATDQNNNPTKVAADVYAASLSPYLGILAQAQDAKNAQSNKYTGILGDILSVGKDGSGTIGDIKSVYSDLSSTLDSISGLDSSNLSLSSEASTSQQQFENATGNNSEVTNAIDQYNSSREIDIEKLNNYVYTYILLQKAGIVSSSTYIYTNSTSSTSTIITVVLDYTNIYSTFINNSTIKLQAIGVKIKQNILSLINKLAIDNYNRQQLEQIVNQNVSISDTLLANILSSSPSIKDIEKNQTLWEYIPEYQSSDVVTDETAIQYLIPTSDEVDNPTTKNNLMNIRIRAYKLGQRLGIPTLSGYDPNIPLDASYLLDNDTASSYSKNAFCNKIANNICN